MNKVRDLYKSMADSELERAMRDIQSADGTGTIPMDSVIRECYNKHIELTGRGTVDIFMVQVYIMREISDRWMRIRNG